MAEPIHAIPQANRSADIADYQPLSTMAVASLVVACFFALLLVVTAIAGFATHKPAVSYEYLFVALVGFFLAVVARIQIRRSEGTRTGMQLTTIAWWICVLGGLGYGAYIVGSGRALRAQSEEFAASWFKDLREGRFNQAFVLTIDPARRRNVVPEDEHQLEAEFGPVLPGFRQNELVRFFVRNGTQVQVEPVGLRNWEPTTGGYRVESSWRLLSPEGNIVLTIVLVGTDAKDAPTRQWHVVFSQSLAPTDMKPTSYGRLIPELVQDAGKLVGRWQENLATRRPALGQVWTLPEAKRPTIEAHFAAQRLVAGPAGDLLAPDVPGLRTPMPGFFKYNGSANVPDEKLAIFRRILSSGLVFRPQVTRGPVAETPALEVSEKEVRITVPVEMQLPDLPLGSTTKARVHVVAANPEFVAKVWELRQAGAQDPNSANLSPERVMKDLPSPQWRIESLDSPLEPAPVQAGPGGAPPPGV
jgi:hypothetical protein